MKYVKAFILAAFILLLGSCKPSVHKEKAVKIYSYKVKKDKQAGPNSTPGIIATTPSNTDETYYYVIWADNGTGSRGVDSYRAGMNCYYYSSPTPVTNFSNTNFTYGKAPAVAEDEELTLDEIVNQQLDELEASLQEAISENPEIQEVEVAVDDESGQTVAEESDNSNDNSNSTDNSNSSDNSDNSSGGESGGEGGGGGGGGEGGGE